MPLGRLGAAPVQAADMGFDMDQTAGGQGKTLQVRRKTR